MCRTAKTSPNRLQVLHTRSIPKDGQTYRISGFPPKRYVEQRAGLECTYLNYVVHPMHMNLSSYKLMVVSSPNWDDAETVIASDVPSECQHVNQTFTKRYPDQATASPVLLQAGENAG
jgi:hypothetical protein